MDKLSFYTFLVSVKALLDNDNIESVKTLIDKLINELEE